MKRLLTASSIVVCLMFFSHAVAQTQIQGALPSYNDGRQGEVRQQQYFPEQGAFVCENGNNRFTRALYGGFTDYRLETSDRPVFAVVKKGYHRNIRFVVNGVSLDSVDYCKAWYVDGMRRYLIRDTRLGELQVEAVALNDREGAAFRFTGNQSLNVQTIISEIANPKLKRNGDIGADAPGVFEAGQPLDTIAATHPSPFIIVLDRNEVASLDDQEKQRLFDEAVNYNRQLTSRIQFDTPDPYINTLGSALALAADGDWDGQTWLHGCIGWRMPLAGWRAAYVGDVLGWRDRQRSHFDAYAKSQVTNVPATIPHPSQDEAMNMARAEKKWGTQMYSNGYICRNPEKNNQMHHYDMNLNYMDELLWHFQYDADTAYMRQMWPVIESHLAWEKRNYDPDGDHLYDAYCCIWASDALYYSGGAVTHSSAYNYRGNLLAARIAELIGKDPKPYREEADAILQAMNERLWMKDKGVWAEYQDGMGLKRLHESPALWSIYTPIDCGACSDVQAWQAVDWVNENIPHINIEDSTYQTISTSNWLPYSWSINNVANAEIWHTALAFFRAGRAQEGYRLMMANILDNMYYGQSPANFGQLSHYDAARGECYRDFGDCIGIASRALVQGLFGVIPYALYGGCYLQPGFPAEWDRATLKTPYIEYTFTRKDGKDRYEITQHFAQPLKMILVQQSADGIVRYIEGTDEVHQVIEVSTLHQPVTPFASRQPSQVQEPDTKWGLDEPDVSRPFVKQSITSCFNSEVDDIFRNKYLSPRPQTTTLQIPVQGVGEWCHPQYTPEINDSVFRTLVKDGQITVAGVPFLTSKEGNNIAYTSLWDNYPDSITISKFSSSARYSSAYLLMAGSTNHMQSRIDNGLVIATYTDGSRDTLRLRNPDNWCPIEQDYFVDGKAFQTTEPRPYRICLGQATADGQLIVSRDLGKVLDIRGVYGREIPGGAAQMLRMPLNEKKKLKSLTLRTLSNDVVIGLMAVTLQ